MKFKLEIELGNDAMRSAFDVARALIRVANRLREERGAARQRCDVVIMDDNGNTVGRWGFHAEEKEAQA